MKIFALAAPVALVLAGCGQNKAAENDADALDRAAEQSTPEAADILRNAADNGADVQNAMQDAGNAQAEAGNGQ
jgi:PBP1b-binding outer membrane lipoprotein LpoB